MPIAVKDINTIATKWKNRASGAAPDYVSGVQAPKRPWAATTAASQNTWGQAVTQAAANGTFAKGVQAAGDATWQSGATTLGAQRYPQGISAGQPKYVSGEQPYLQTLANLTLPPRGVKGTNAARTDAVVQAMMATKQAQG